MRSQPRSGRKGRLSRPLAANLYRRLHEDWPPPADRRCYSFTAWNAARGSGTQLLWRVKADPGLPLVEALPNGSYTSVLINPQIRGKARDALLATARAGQVLIPDAPATARLTVCLDHHDRRRRRRRSWPRLTTITRTRLPGRDRRRHRPRPGQVPTGRPDHPPPRHRFGGSPPDRQTTFLAMIMTSLTAKRHLNPIRKDRT